MRGKSGRPDWRDELAQEEEELRQARHRRRSAPPAAEEEHPRGLIHRIFYWLCVAAIAAIWVWAYKAYFRQYDSTHPRIVWAVRWHRPIVERMEGVLLWDEKLVTSQRAGTVTYPGGTAPRKVAKGAVVAKIRSGGRVYDITAPDEGYFIGGLDGLEGKWRYSELWLGSAELPTVPEITMLTEGASIRAGGAVGKLIPMPQQLRFIGYKDLSDELRAMLERRELRVRMDDLDSPSAAEVRVHEIYGHSAKICLTVPWFQPSLAKSRAYSLIVDMGVLSGVVVPESAIAVRDGRTGVFALDGDEAVFTEIEGRALDGGYYLLTKGVKLGDAVVADAENAAEGRISLW